MPGIVLGAMDAKRTEADTVLALIQHNISLMREAEMAKQTPHRQAALECPKGRRAGFCGRK